MTVADIVATLESRGMTFGADRSGLLRFSYEDAALQKGDSELVGELVLEREDEALAFIRRRERLDDFGKFAGLFRSYVFRIWNAPEMLPWLRLRAPKLYKELTERLPDRVCTLWQEGASLEEFTRAIADLEEVRSVAVNFYSTCLPEGGERSSNQWKTKPSRT
jgi:hypothetical protein